MITCLIATHNGAAWLPKTLEGYQQLQSPPGGWKLVVIDNASTDDTRSLIDRFTSHLPLTVIAEPRRGKNTALNTGLTRLEGDLAVFSDDDAIPHHNWLVELRKCADAHSEFSIFGGVVLPRWEIPPPDWLLKWVPLQPTFAITNPTWEEGPINPLHIFGPNMAVRADVFQSGYRFNTSVGPSAGSYAMGSETEFTNRLARSGFRCWHCKGAVVEHIVRRSQMEKTWVLNRALRYGRGQYRLTKSELTPKLLFGFPRYLIREVIVQWARLQTLRLTGSEEEQFKARWLLKYLAGQTQEGRQFHAEGEGALED